MKPCSCVGSGVTGIAHFDGSHVQNGVWQMMGKMKWLCRGAPEGR